MLERVIYIGAIVLGLAGTVPDAEARARRMICEEWRDYYYSVETDEFLGWAGDPYWECWYVDEPVSRPTGNPPFPDYGCCWGIPRDPRQPTCQQCDTQYIACTKRVARGRDRCLDHYHQQAHEWCVNVRRTRDGIPIGDDYLCVEVRNPSGKPVQDCFGPAIDACEEDFARDRPGSTVQDTVKVNIGLDWFSVGADHTSTVMWGGSHGYVWGCFHAQLEASAVCVSNQDTCEEAAGGCR